MIGGESVKKKRPQKRLDLQILRMNAGYKTVGQAAKELPIGESMLTKIENGHRTPSGDTAIAMAELYGCTLNHIFLNNKVTISVQMRGNSNVTCN